MNRNWCLVPRMVIANLQACFKNIVKSENDWENLQGEASLII